FTRSGTPAVGKCPSGVYQDFCGSFDCLFIRYRHKLPIFSYHRGFYPVMLEHADKLAVPKNAGIFYFCNLIIFYSDCDIVAEGSAEGAYCVFNYWHIFSSEFSGFSGPDEHMSYSIEGVWTQSSRYFLM